MKRNRLVIWIVVLAAAAVLLALVGDGLRFSPEDHRISISCSLLAVLLVLIAGIMVMACFAVKANSDQAYKKLAMTDLLTGLGNRYAVRELLKQFEKTALPENLIVVYLDVDDLKCINDRYGHAAGDEVLCAAAAAMKAAFGEAGQCFRVGGDEFLVVLRTGREALYAMLEEFYRQTAVWQGRYAGGYAASVGFAAAADHPEMAVETLIQIADRRMYKEKEGRTGGEPC